MSTNELLLEGAAEIERLRREIERLEREKAALALEAHSYLSQLMERPPSEPKPSLPMCDVCANKPSTRTVIAYGIETDVCEDCLGMSNTVKSGESL